LPESICYIYKDLDAFDVSNNFICPPYPKCFEFIGFQNTNVCTYSEKDSANIITKQQSTMNVQSDMVKYQNDILNKNILNTTIWETSCSNGYVKYSDNCYFQLHIDILQDFIDHNISLENMEPLEIGEQKWSNNKLIDLNLGNLQINTIPDSIGLFKDLKILDLSNNNLTSIPDGLCNIYTDYSTIILSNNKICPPYPFCFDYISHQNTSDCEQKLCPDNYKKINGECLHSEHVIFLESLVDSNKALSDFFANLDIAEFYNEIGYQIWENGKIDTLIIKDSNLITIPENICSIYYDIAAFDISNNSICPPYPTCFNNVENQNLESCDITLMPQFSCPDGCVSYYNSCYYYDDLEVMNDFIKINEVLTNLHPLSIGNQLWKNNRIIQLNFSGMGITNIPESVYKLNRLKTLYLSDNNLNVLPNNFCLLYPQLKNFEIIHNNICPPYIECFDFIGYQNTDSCEKSFCPYGYLDIEGECYFEKDVSILNDFISQNKSLDGRQPLEIGVQKWQNMRLHYLYLGDNDLTTAPESICEIIPQLKTFNISQNYICQPYPACVEEYIGEQDGTNCP